MLQKQWRRWGAGVGMALLFAIFAALATGVSAQPRDAGQSRNTGQTAPDDCLECHESIVTHWQDSAHGQAAVAPGFQQAWQEAGSPDDCLGCHSSGKTAADGVTCDACHSLTANGPHHPEQIMLTDPSSRLCGSCHRDTLAEWQTSEHGQGDLTCIRCHNPHTTSMKKASVQETCQACHNEESHLYTMSDHANADLLCTDCHLRVSDSPMGEGHGQRLHTFAVDLSTCNSCHADDMHMPAASTETAAAQPCAAGETTLAQGTDGGSTAVSLQPTAASTVNFIALAAIIGLAFGIVGSPWLERQISTRLRLK